MKLQTKKKGIAKLLICAILITVCNIGNCNITAKAADIQNFQITGTYQQTEARTMLTMINSFRTGEDAWQWNENDTEKVPITELKELQFDYNLEKIAMQRAMELVVGYSHTRPSGESCFTAYTSGYMAYGENIAIGTSNLSAAKVFELWQETDEPYAGQGHRRNMLSKTFHAIGIAHVYYNGCHYWVQEFGDRTVTETFEPANDSETAVSVSVNSDRITTLNYTSNVERYPLNVGDTVALPAISLELRTVDTWGYAPSALATVTDSPAWEIKDTTIANISGNNINAVSPGTTSLIGVIGGKTIEIPITVADSQTSPDVPPAENPTVRPSEEPMATPTATPMATPTVRPTVTPTTTPTVDPTTEPPVAPTETPTTAPIEKPTATPDFNSVNLSENATVTLNKKSYTYNGKEKKPVVTITAGIETLTKDTDYTVSYKNNVKVGTASVIITGKGAYTGSVTLTFKILPKGINTLGKIKAKSKGFTVNWKKQTKSTTGYQIQYSTSKKFMGNTTVTKTIGKASTTKLTVNKLKSKKKYYVRIRTYKTVNGKKYYSSWSNSKSITTR